MNRMILWLLILPFVFGAWTLPAHDGDHDSIQAEPQILQITTCGTHHSARSQSTCSVFLVLEDGSLLFSENRDWTAGESVIKLGVGTQGALKQITLVNLNRNETVPAEAIATVATREAQLVSVMANELGLELSDGHVWQFAATDNTPVSHWESGDRISIAEVTEFANFWEDASVNWLISACHESPFLDPDAPMSVAIITNLECNECVVVWRCH